MTNSVISNPVGSEYMLAEANYIAEFMYGLLSELPEEETYYAGSKLRGGANDVLFYTAEALGDTSASATDYDWTATRKHVSGLKTMYRFCSRQQYFEIDPSVMVRINKFIEQIDVAIDYCRQQTKIEADKDLDQWRQKYKLWKEMSDEN